MAATDYVRLGCAMEACQGKHKAHGYCLRHYRHWQRGGVKQDATTCAHCGAAMQGKVAGSMYCSQRCKRAAWRQAHPEREEVFRGREAQKKTVCAIYAGYCEQCGGSMVRRRKSRWCSTKCQNKARFVSIAPSHKNCRRCGVLFKLPPFKTVPPPFCSRKCRDETQRTQRRVQKRKRNAAQRGVHAEAVDPIKVFERDRWRCKLCGERTPKEKRGTCDDDAPELDHIIPLSQGGEHTYRNTQCACRRCNGQKGAKPLGQLLLIG
jgi:5-methylcytosine-specific restriction endonuclease McrA